MDALVTHGCRSVAPTSIAPVGSANQAGISARIDRLDRLTAVIHREVIIDEKIRGGGITDLRQAFCRHRLLDGHLHAVANDVVLSVVVAHRSLSLIAGQGVARSHSTIISAKHCPHRPARVATPRSYPSRYECSDLALFAHGRRIRPVPSHSGTRSLPAPSFSFWESTKTPSLHSYLEQLNSHRSI